MISYDLELPSGARVAVRFTDAQTGDFAAGSDVAQLADALGSVTAYRWTELRQVHGTDVVAVSTPGLPEQVEADASITATPGATIGVKTADCVPVILVGSNGVVGAVHAGWKGATNGVVPAAIDAMRKLDCGQLQAFIGPAIGPECYEFGEADLQTVADALGEVVRARTSDDKPALDLVVGIEQQLESLDVAVTTVGKCTACEGSWFSHRARADKGRQASFVWIEP